MAAAALRRHSGSWLLALARRASFVPPRPHGLAARAGRQAGRAATTWEHKHHHPKVWIRFLFRLRVAMLARRDLAPDLRTGRRIWEAGGRQALA